MLRQINDHERPGSGLPGEQRLSELVALATALTHALAERALTGLGRQDRRTGAAAEEPLQVRFDLRGKGAGQMRVDARGRCVIRYNLELLRRHGDDFLQRTVPHEVAHYVAYRQFGRSIRPHGAEWRAIMRRLGADATRCHDYDVTGLGARALRYYDYHCSCMEHRLSSIRHNKARNGQHYLCRRCGEPLRPGRSRPLPGPGGAP